MFKGKNINLIGDCLDRTWEDLSQRRTGDRPEFPLGFDLLDDKLWGFHKKRLTVIGGRPGDGKSTFMLNLCMNLLKYDTKVLVISREMSTESLIERLFCIHQKVENTLLLKGKLNDGIHNKYGYFSDYLKNKKLMIVDEVGKNFKETEGLIRSLSPRPDVIFIDYVQMISQSGFSNKHQAVSEYTRDLYEFSKNYDVSSVLVSQMRRKDSGSGRPHIEELKYSGSLEENADIVLMIYWEYNHGGDRDFKNNWEVKIAKHRQGPISGWLALNYQPQYCLLENDNSNKFIEDDNEEKLPF